MLLIAHITSPQEGRWAGGHSANFSLELAVVEFLDLSDRYIIQCL